MSRGDSRRACEEAAAHATFTPETSHLPTRFVIAPNDRVKFQATAGMTYSFEVASDNGLTGSIILKLAPITLPALLYQTQFEPEEGFATNFSLQGQQGWTGSARGGSDIVFDWIPGNGQQAVIGFDPAFSAGGSLKLWKPVNYDPAVMGKVVRFSVFLGLSESSGPNSDVFGWTFYNRSAAPLFSILFDNSTLQVGYSLDDGKGFHPTGHSFLNYNNVHLQVLADFQNNRWSAWLGQTPIVDQQPITVANATLDVGRVAALWQAAPGLAPGDNFMIFDDFTLAIETNSLPVIFVQPESQAIPSGGDARLAVAASGLEPLAYQWMFNGVNIPGATNSVLFLPSVQRNQQGAYTVEVRSPFQSALSNPASLQFQDAAAGRISAAQFEADGRFGLEIQGSKDSIYFVESSTDLLQWTPLGAVVITNSTPFIDSKNTVLNYRFYRVRPVR